MSAGFKTLAQEEGQLVRRYRWTVQEPLIPLAAASDEKIELLPGLYLFGNGIQTETSGDRDDTGGDSGGRLAPSRRFV